MENPVISGKSGKRTQRRGITRYFMYVSAFVLVFFSTTLSSSFALNVAGSKPATQKTGSFTTQFRTANGPSPAHSTRRARRAALRAVKHPGVSGGWSQPPGWTPGAFPPSNGSAAPVQSSHSGTTYPARGGVGGPTSGLTDMYPPGGAGYFTYNSDVTLDHVYMHGAIDFYGNTLTITNSRVLIDGSKWWGGIMMRNPNSTLIIRDTSVIGINAQYATSGNPDGIRFASGGRLQADGIEVTGTADGIKFTTGWLRDSWIHDLAALNGNHNDGVQIMGGNNIEFSRDRIELYTNLSQFVPEDDNSALFFQPFGTGTTITNVLVDNNYLEGGYFAFRVESNTQGGGSSGFTVTNNVFGPPPTGGWYALLTNNPGINQWSGNVVGDIAGNRTTTPVNKP